MFKKILVAALAAAASAAVAFWATVAYQENQIDREAKTHAEWANKVAAGGFILHFRHAQREKWNDVTAFDAIELLKNYTPADIPFPRATCLTEQGQQEAKLIKDVFEAAHVKVGKVISSPSCRSRMTAEIAFGHIDQISNSLLHRTAIPRRQHTEFAAELRRVIVNSPPQPGTNTVLSGHGGTLRFDRSLVMDENHVGNPDDRQEGGFIVFEVVDGRVIARHKFTSLHDFANAALELPVHRPSDALTALPP